MLWLASLVLIGRANAQTALGNTLNPHVMVSNGDVRTSCSGSEEEEVGCGFTSTSTECSGCVPVNCALSTWAEWGKADANNCNQICSRKREVATPNNECGRACNVSLTETKSCPIRTCTTETKDCVWAEWGAWGSCTSDLDQKTRSRSMTPAQHGGLACHGPSKETYPCGQTVLPLDCELSQWHTWTDCSATCGQGIRTRARRWKQDAKWGGMPCTGPIQVIADCVGAPCPGSQNCVSSAWSNWVGCQPGELSQRFRVRSIMAPNVGGGTPCPKNIKETDPCPDTINTCVFSAWEAWSKCDKECDGGQQRRSRKVTSFLHTVNASACPAPQTQETQGCNAQKCNNAADNCAWEAWSQWAACLPSCGSGMSDRQRKIQKEATGDGIGCQGPQEELKPCNGPVCSTLDCIWEEWSDWGACTTSCGGGTNQRIRNIKQKPRYGGKSCSEVAGSLPEQKWPWSQIAPCNTQQCGAACVNGTWGSWSSWSACSATCDTGFRTRRRDLEQVPNACGYPAVGAENEIVQCKVMDTYPAVVPILCVPKVDCMVSKWSQWSGCSTSCFGTSQRQRLIERFSSGGGVQCHNESLKEIRPCNPFQGVDPSSSCSVLPKHDCTMTDWGRWNDCPVSCGGGQHTRARRIIQPPSGGGKSCNATLTMTKTCNKHKCGTNCTDCKWGQWDSFGACSKCGGQRYRQRRVEQLPNHCGAACLTRTALETASCPDTHCGDTYWCIWGAWSAFTQCSGTCGNVTKQRQRRLQITKEPPLNANISNDTFLFKSHKNLMCAGTEFHVDICKGLASCAARKCIPVNCEMGAWSLWGPAQLTGLCQRSRGIATNNNDCGDPCNGNLIETKTCIPTWLKPQDCELSIWGQWSHCPTMIAQRYKVRGVFRQASNGGVSSTCDGALGETVSCKHTHTPIDCGLTDWTIWGTCTKTCGAGWMYRTRQANHPQMKYGGTACAGGLKELAVCNTFSCQGVDVDCLFGAWSTWGVCFEHQKSRFRGIDRMASGLNGAGCQGPLEDTTKCGGESVDCKVSEWTAWDECDLECGGGQQNRHRTIYGHPKNNGTACPTVNKETQGCNLAECSGSRDCMLSSWTVWTRCDTDCGIGQMKRTRSITQLRSEGGAGCQGDLEESVPCGTAPPAGTTCPVVDCVWDQWTAWHKCSKDCGTGHHERTRAILTPAGPGGKVCEAGNMTEAKPCNSNSCSGRACIDGVWDAWSAWEACSATCGGGVSWRTRSIKTTANFCGKAAVGEAKELEQCNHLTSQSCSDENSACVWSTWGAWSACDKTCNGVTHRDRKIEKMGTGTAAGCNGTFKDVANCNPGTGERKPDGCPDLASDEVTDCKFSEWEAWGTCSHSCGGGVQIRNRTIATFANNGGKLCTGSISQATPCNHDLCPGSIASVNCKWDEWSVWGACDTCGGTQTRHRVVKKQALRNGTMCLAGDASDVKACDPTSMPTFERYCGAAKYCSWQTWGAWGACSSRCASATKKRKRELQASIADPYTTTSTTTAEMRRVRLYDDADMQEVTAMRQVRVARQGQTHVQELIMAFAAGGASLFLLLTAMRACSSGRSSPNEAASDEFRSSSDSLMSGLE